MAALARLTTPEIGKFRDPDVTADGDRRATVAFTALDTLWFNTGTLCNLSCRNCYIESSPRNDRLAYLTATEAAGFLDEIEDRALGTTEIGFTGGEPFMNRDIIAMIEDGLRRGFRTLVLTNAMRPMMKFAEPLIDLRERYGERLLVRVSLDHYARAVHELERGQLSWQPTLDGLRWLTRNGFATHVAGRNLRGEPETELREGYARLFAEYGIPIDTRNPVALMLFPEMDTHVDVPEITEACWDTLGVNPDSVMCATSRMVIKRKGAGRPVVVSCTLLPYADQFEMGHTLLEAENTVRLNHPHCAQFCVLGGGSCSKP